MISTSSEDLLKQREMVKMITVMKFRENSVYSK
jgi:hypothetical protein